MSKKGEVELADTSGGKKKKGHEHFRAHGAEENVKQVKQVGIWEQIGGKRKQAGPPVARAANCYAQATGRRWVRWGCEGGRLSLVTGRHEGEPQPLGPSAQNRPCPLAGEKVQENDICAAEQVARAAGQTGRLSPGTLYRRPRSSPS